MFDKIFLENGEMLRFIHDTYKNQDMCDKAVDSYPSAIQVVSECYQTQKTSDKLLILVLLYLIVFLINIALKR